MNELWDIRTGDVREQLELITDESVQCVVTSPPYWGLRDYGLEPSVWGGDVDCDHEWVDRSWYVNGGSTTGAAGGAFSKQGTDNAERIKNGRWRSDATCTRCDAWLGCLGLEPTPAEYLEHIITVFREIRRVLRPDGTVWLNIGDSYSGSGVNDGTKSPSLSNAAKRGHPEERPAAKRWNCPLKPKDLIGIPWRVALALQDDGWWLRRDIIWSKPNPMPESVTDRPTSAHEYMFLLTKSARYYYDADAVRTNFKGSVDWKEPDGWDTGAGAHGTIHRNGRSKGRKSDKQRGHSRRHTGFNDRWDSMTAEAQRVGGANLRSVWEIATRPFPGAHFATFPEKLVEPCIKAGTSEHGECPECGAPWKRVVEISGESTTSKKKQRGGSKKRGSGGKLITQSLDFAGGHGDGVRASKTLGWQPGCDHQNKPVPQTVLDPFSGAGTTGLVSARFGRKHIGIELNPEYAEMSRQRIADWELSDLKKIGAETIEEVPPGVEVQSKFSI